MKKIKIYFLVILLISVFSCKKDNIMIYEQNAGVYFNTGLSVYSFFENPDKVDVGFDSIYIPVKITGLALDYDRYVEVEVVDTSSRHTALPKMFSVGKGIVKANMYEGYVPVRVNYSEELDDSLRRIILRINPSDDFSVTDLKRFDLAVSIGNVAMAPENWSQLKGLFGNYSNSWYSFILKACGRKSIPYKYFNGWSQSGITPEEAGKWPLTYDEARAIAYQVKEVLTEYNDKHEKPLMHEDGEYINTPVQMKI